MWLRLVGFAAVVAVGAAVLSEVGYQAHSFNDLRSWRQLLLKGARTVKVDPHYLDASACSEQVNANHSDTRGCFVLNHDTPTPGRSDFNTSTQLLDLIASNALRPWMTQASSRFFVALCFKGW
jgi:hypothetical protein